MPLDPLPNPSGFPERLKGNFRLLVAGLFLFSTLLFFNLIQTLSLVIRPLSSSAFRRFNRFLANTWWGWCAILARRIYRVEVQVSGDDVPIQENAMVVCNHQEMTDIPVLFDLAMDKQRLGDLKWYVKDVLKYVPGMGWGMLFLDCLFIKRNWTEDKEKIHRIFSRLLTHKVPVWVISFAEGTRIRPRKLERSQEFARTRGLPVLRHLLSPRTKGFSATVSAMGGHLTAVYDVTIGYIGGVPSLAQWAKGYVRKVNLHVRRFPIETLPRDEEGLSDWLLARFAEKDELLEHHYKTGAFPA